MTRLALFLLASLLPACQSLPLAQVVIPDKLPLPLPEDPAAAAPGDPAPAAAQVHLALGASESALAEHELRQLVGHKAQTMAHDALGEATWRVGSAWQDPLETVDAKATLVAWKTPGGAPRSVGTTSQGSLLNAMAIAPKGPHHEVIDRAKARQTRWGHPALVAALMDAADHVATAHPGSVLALGNLSKWGGGDIHWSVSHNSGRDADVAFFVTRRSTKAPLEMAPDLVEFDDQGLALAYPDLAFDVPRNWALAKALLMSPHADVQFLFVSQPLKDKMLAHAQSLGEPEEVMERAQLAMRQPEGALPHNDHFHLRIRCPKADRLNGCVDQGPRWSWLDWHHDELLGRTVAMIPLLQGEDDDLKLQALAYIQAIESPYATEFALTYGLPSPNPEVRKRALEVASSLWSYTGAGVMAMQWALDHPQSDEATRAKLLAMMRQSLDPWVIPWVQQRLALETLSPKERSRAVWVLAHQMEETLVPYLLDQLRAEPSPQVRRTLGRVLHRVTNRQEEALDWGTSPAQERATSLTRWQAWWEAHRVEPRAVWVVQGLQQAAPEVTLETLETPAAIEAMIRALPTAPDHLAYNLNRTLRQATGRWSPLELTHGQKLYERWNSWWKVQPEHLVAASHRRQNSLALNRVWPISGAWLRKPSS